MKNVAVFSSCYKISEFRSNSVSMTAECDHDLSGNPGININ